MNHNRCYNRVAKPPSCNIYPRFTPDEKPCKLYAFRCASFLTHPAVNRTATFHRHHHHVCWFCVMSLAHLGEATVRSQPADAIAAARRVLYAKALKHYY